MFHTKDLFHKLYDHSCQFLHTHSLYRYDSNRLTIPIVIFIVSFSSVMINRVNCSIHSPFSDMTPIGFKFQLVIFMVLSAYSLCYQIDYFFETIKQKRDGISSIYNNSFRSTKTNKTILLLMWNSSKGII